ncbi:hypothetical protein [Streptomyces kronopolitis]
MAKKSKLGFAFTIQSGPRAGLTSGPWRAWTSKEDTYVTSVSLGGTWKISLHGDAAWRIAVTAEHMRQERPVWPKGIDRAPWKFSPTQFHEGRRLAFVIAASRGSLIPGALSDKDIHISVEDRWDLITMAQMWMTEPGVEIPGTWRVVGDALKLASGRRVWIIKETQHVPGDKEEQIAAGIMSEPMLPGTHDVSAPGILLRGVHVQESTGSRAVSDT